MNAMIRQRRFSMLKFRRGVRWTLVLLAMLAALFFFLFPIYWALTLSVKPKSDVLVTLPYYFPVRFTADNYVSIFEKSNFGQFLWNSAYIAVITTMLCVLVSAMAGFGLTRFRFRGGKAISSAIYIVRMIPGLVYTVPLFILFRKLNLLDSHEGLILAYCTFSLPMSIWLFISFYEEIPKELYESGVLDGCSEYQLFYSIALPLVLPSVSVVAILCFLGAWNEFGLAMCLTFKDSAKTLPVAINSLIQREQDVPYGSIAAGGTLIMLPAIILSMTTQKYIVKGFTAGAVKG
ncbi:MAG: carbohydrate ABC transporter permease [Eubacteriales bacterium]|nr:carbohydrate ABC transporter permease [Eubacteriales bacterium]